MLDLGLLAVHAALAMHAALATYVSRLAHSFTQHASHATLELGGIVTFDPATLSSLTVGSHLPTSLLTREHARHADMVLRSRTMSLRGIFLQYADPTSPAVHASLFLRDGRLTGAMYGEGSLRTVLRCIDAGVCSVSVEDANRDRPCGCADLEFVNAPTPLGNASEGGIAGSVCDDGSSVDVLVVYTDAAVAQAGSEIAVLDEIAWAILDSNATYAGSGIALTMRLVGASRLNGFVEAPADLGADLVALTSSTDGIIDSVHALRDETDADLVALVRADSPLSCGVAWILQENSSSESPSGFSVTALGCFANRTFTHELAHNMGCCHAPNDGGGCSHAAGVFPDSMGHRFTGADGVDYRTIMAYAPGLRIPRFSSPLVSWASTPTGILYQCDNARTINETKLAFTNYRCAPVSGSCGSPSSGDCCASHIEPFCNDARCCAFICANDAYCCETTWDARCADSARALFAGCCVTDLDGDGNTGASDLAALLSAWSTPTVDFDSNGTCDAQDLATLLEGWGPCL